jgi:hypothetical protein
LRASLIGKPGQPEQWVGKAAPLRRLWLMLNTIPQMFHVKHFAISVQH